MLDSARAKLKADLVAEEGRVPHMYLDTEGYVTVGVGHLLAKAADAEQLAFVDRKTRDAASSDAIAAEYAAIKKLPKAKLAKFYGATATLVLPDAAIDALLDADIDVKRRELCRASPCRDFDQFPAEAQLALLDMAFNLGTSKLTKQFKKLMACVERGDWAGCAQECTVKNIQASRNEARRALFLAAAAGGTDTSTAERAGPAPPEPLAVFAAQSPVGSTQMAKKMPRVRHMLAHIAPKLASALLTGSPLAGVAKKFIAERLGKDDLPDGKGLHSFLEDLTGHIEGLKQVKELERQFELEMDKLEVNVFDLEVDDRKSARELASKDIRPQLYLSIAFVIAYFMILGGVIWAEISPNFNPGAAWIPEATCADAPGDCPGRWEEQGESLIDVMQVLLGVLTAGVAQILNFWFGGLMRRNQPGS